MDKIMRGILKFNSKLRKDYLADLQKVSEQIVKPVTVFITCMDCRLNPFGIIQAKPGEVFIMRNPGNMVPYFDSARLDQVFAEGAGLELGCIMNNIGNVVVCGHSDCKAVNSMYSQRHSCSTLPQHTMDTPLKAWLCVHGQRTLQRFTELFSEEEQQMSARGETVLGGFKVKFGRDEFVCAVDPQNKFTIENKLSQFHCLQQASHVASYPILQPYIASGEVKVQAMWFDIPNALMYMFSPSRGCFVPIDESSADGLRKEIAS